MPALICAWREGIWPSPACSTWPITTCCDLLGLDAGALERGLDGDAAELGGLRGRRGRRRACRRACGRRRGSRSWAWDRDDSLRAMDDPGHHRQTRPTPAPTPSSSACSTARASPHDVAGRRAAARCSSPARRSPGSASSPHTHADGQALDPRRARRARRRSTPSARGSPPRSRSAARASSARATLCWELPHHVDDARRRRARRGHAAGRLPLRPRSSPTPDDGPRGPDALVVSAHHDVARGRRRGGASAPRRPTRRATSATRPPTRMTPERAGRARGARARRACTVEVDGPRRRSRPRGMGAFAAVAQGADARAAADHAALRARRARRARCSGSSARRSRSTPAATRSSPPRACTR